MEVIEVSTPLDDAFLVEAAMLLASVSVGVGDATFLLAGEPSVEGVLICNIYVETAIAMSLQTANQQGRLNGIMFGLQASGLHALQLQELEPYSRL